jgi:hypothetical protein
MFVILGLLTMLVPLYGYLNPHVRNVEEELPDAAAQVVAEPGAGLAAEVAVAQAD